MDLILGILMYKGLGADISSLHYSTSRTEALVKQLAFNDTSGFALDTTHVKFLMTDSILSAVNYM